MVALPFLAGVNATNNEIHTTNAQNRVPLPQGDLTV
jgi:hypothetical protein